MLKLGSLWYRFVLFFLNGDTYEPIEEYWPLVYITTSIWVFTFTGIFGVHEVRGENFLPAGFPVEDFLTKNLNTSLPAGRSSIKTTADLS